MDERTLEDIEFHQDFIRSEKPSPLNMIREKEMELSGRVLACKKDAEKMVTEARKKAADIIAAAEKEAAEMAAAREKEVIAEAEAEAERTRGAALTELETLSQEIDKRKDDAARAVVEMVVDG